MNRRWVTTGLFFHFGRASRGAGERRTGEGKRRTGPTRESERRPTEVDSACARGLEKNNGQKEDGTERYGRMGTAAIFLSSIFLSALICFAIVGDETEMNHGLH